MTYRLLVDSEVLDFAFALSSAQQRRLFKHFAAIKALPYHYADSVESIRNEPPLKVSFFEAFQIRYWIDNADHHVKILHIDIKD